MFLYDDKMIFTEEDQDLIVRCWIRYQLDPQTSIILEQRLPEPDYRKTLSMEGDVWPWDDNPEGVISSINYGNPQLAYEIILKIADMTDDEWLLELLAAGPVESLIKYHDDHLKYRKAYEALAKNSEKHKFVLSMVWL
jgi:hypothetical protein